MRRDSRAQTEDFGHIYPTDEQMENYYARMKELRRNSSPSIPSESMEPTVEQAAEITTALESPVVPPPSEGPAETKG